MRFYSTRDSSHFVSAEDAIVANLCPRGGLYMPEFIPINSSLKEKQDFSLSKLGFEIAKSFLSESFEIQELEAICEKTFNFPAPIFPLAENLAVLELTHGPSLAFKDFGARFMAACLELIAKKRNAQYSVLTATSGDTGAAVAAALHNKPGISVTILYPYKRISPFQEGQMTRFGDNVKTIAVEGTFDDCQRLVKEAFSRQDLSLKWNLVSANSINISRLLAQMVYYLHAIRILNFRNDLSFVVPSGNLGNLCAGVFAAKYIDSKCKFVAAHNKNSTFPEYLSTGEYKACESKPSLSNAMDVGAPSNFERLQCLFKSELSEFRDSITAQVVSDQETVDEMKQAYQHYGYLACPHTAVALKAARSISGYKVALATAHPKKFSDVLLKAEVPFSDVELTAVTSPADFIIKPQLSELLKVF